jgi:IS30 family transposase
LNGQTKLVPKYFPGKKIRNRILKLLTDLCMQILLKRLWDQDDVTITVDKNTKLLKINFLHSRIYQKLYGKSKKNVKKFYEQYLLTQHGPEPALVED